MVNRKHLNRRDKKLSLAERKVCPLSRKSQKTALGKAALFAAYALGKLCFRRKAERAAEHQKRISVKLFGKLYKICVAGILQRLFHCLLSVLFAVVAGKDGIPNFAGTRAGESHILRNAALKRIGGNNAFKNGADAV